MKARGANFLKIADDEKSLYVIFKDMSKSPIFYSKQQAIAVISFYLVHQMISGSEYATMTNRIIELNGLSTICEARNNKSPLELFLETPLVNGTITSSQVLPTEYKVFLHGPCFVDCQTCGALTKHGVIFYDGGLAEIYSREDGKKSLELLYKMRKISEADVKKLSKEMNKFFSKSKRKKKST
jgi:hypothetical protein